ncbi:hypothetical protein Tco_0828938 [Tanacetum coccineum]
MQAARDRQKSYADLKSKQMEFQVRDKVMLKVSPWKGVTRFGKQGKLNPRYVGPFKVLEKVGECYADEPLAVPLDGLHFDDKLQFVEEPVEIMDREVKRLKRRRIPLVKVRWNTNSRRNTHTSSPRPHRRQVLHQALDTQSTQTIKLPILQPGEYDLWKMRMEQYLQCIDYTLWEIIENGNAPIVTKTVDGKETVIPPTSVEEKAQRKA